MTGVPAACLDVRHLTFGDVSVPYHYGADCPEELIRAVVAELADTDTALVVLDANIAHHADAVVAALAGHLRVVTYPLDALERHKTLPTVHAVLEHATRHGLTRRSAVVAMGGGTIGNIAGLAAALLYRGVRLVHLPTTPVAAFDSVISIKQGVNLPDGKNLCGTYFPPALVACDLRWLATVPRSSLLTGLAEMAKNVLVTVPAEEDRFVSAVDRLDSDPAGALRDLLDIGIEAKHPYLVDDPHERGSAIVFEYGHTAGHAIEFAYQGAVGHGEAVAWGMLVAAEVGRLVRGTDPATVEAHRRLVAGLDLPDPRRRFRGLDRAAIRRALLADNKRGHAPCGPDEVLMVLLDAIGRPASATCGLPLVRVPVDVVMNALDTALELEAA